MTGTTHPLSGELTEAGHRLAQRVYYEDTDFSGVVYDARYLHFLERGRTDYLRLLGVEQGSLVLEEDREGLVFVVHRMEIDFKAPARMDDILTILTSTAKAGGAKMILNQEIRRGDQLLIAARVIIAVINAAGYHRIDEAEGNPQACFRDNADGPEVLAAACARLGIGFMTFSSDQVFDGSQDWNYVESCTPAPLNVSTWYIKG